MGVNLTTATTETILPCSSYLTAQSSFLDIGDYESGLSESQDPQSPFPEWPEDWSVNFGQSPECRSFAQGYSKAEYTFSDCGSSNTIISGESLTKILQSSGATFPLIYPLQIPPGVVRRFSPEDTDTCCGNCTLDAPEVRLLYFPDDESTNCASNGTWNATSTVFQRANVKRMQSIVGDGDIAIFSGHTL